MAMPAVMFYDARGELAARCARRTRGCGTLIVPAVGILGGQKPSSQVRVLEQEGQGHRTQTLARSMIAQSFSKAPGPHHAGDCEFVQRA